MKFNKRGYPTFRGGVFYGVIIDAKQRRQFGTNCLKCGKPTLAMTTAEMDKRWGPGYSSDRPEDGTAFCVTLADAGLYHVKCTPKGV